MQNNLNNTLTEIQTSLKYLEESQKSITSLIEAKIEHRIEIKHLSIGMEHLINEVKNIDSRLVKIENLLTLEEEKSNYRARVFEFMHEYWHIGVVIIGLISFILHIFFGVKVQYEL